MMRCGDLKPRMPKAPTGLDAWRPYEHRCSPLPVGWEGATPDDRNSPREANTLHTSRRCVDVPLALLANPRIPLGLCWLAEDRLLASALDIQPRERRSPGSAGARASTAGASGGRDLTPPRADFLKSVFQPGNARTRQTNLNDQVNLSQLDLT